MFLKLKWKQYKYQEIYLVWLQFRAMISLTEQNDDFVRFSENKKESHMFLSPLRNSAPAS